MASATSQKLDREVKRDGWEAKAAYIIAKTPSIKKIDVAKAVGVHPAQIGRSKMCNDAYAMAALEKPVWVYEYEVA